MTEEIVFTEALEYVREGRVCEAVTGSTNFD